VLILETSEELLPARNVGWIVRSLGERGILAAAEAVLVARPPASDHARQRPLTNARGCALSSETSLSISSAGTTLKPSCASASRSGTRARSGSSRMAVSSRSMAPRAGLSLTTHSRSPLGRPVLTWNQIMPLIQHQVAAAAR
jgi:hypothetical protein